MPRYESLEAKSMRQIPPGLLNQLPSPLLMKGQNEMAKHIQRRYRSRNRYATYRKGSKMTKKTMQIQLINGYAFNPERQDNAFIRMLHDFLHMFNIVNNEQSDANKIKYFINNLKRPLLEELYNYTFHTSDDEEDTRHLNNPMYFHQANQAPTSYSGGRKQTKKKRNDRNYRKSK